MVIADFQEENKVDRLRFFQKTFLLAKVKFEVILEKLFLKINNVGILFGKKTLIKKSYSINKSLPTTEQIELINLKNLLQWHQKQITKLLLCIYLSKNKNRQLQILIKRPRSRPRLVSYYLMRLPRLFQQNIPITIISFERKIQGKFQSILE